MADDAAAPPPIRLMNFVSEDQLVEARKTRGARVEDGTAQRDRSLFEILQENKDKKDAEFNERFKHQPPKALDEDETEFLDRLETSRKELERQLADEEERQLRSFQAAVEAQSTIVHEMTEEPSIPTTEDKKVEAGRKNPPSRPVSVMIKVKPQAKKAKLDAADSVKTPSLAKADIHNTKNMGERESVHSVDTKSPVTHSSNANSTGMSGLVSYSDESDDE